MLEMGGGAGPYTVLSGMYSYTDRLFVSAIITATDNGGSSRTLRDQYGVLPYGDLGQALAALSDRKNRLRRVFGHRFAEGGTFSGHSAANTLLHLYHEVYPDINEALKELGMTLGVHGRVIPVSKDSIHLCGRTASGREIRGEDAVEHHLWNDSAPIIEFWIDPPDHHINPLAAEAIVEADLIVIGPGSLFTSLIPVLIVNGVADALQNTKATLVHIANLMTEVGQAGHYTVQNYADEIQSRLGRSLDYVIYNTQEPDTELLAGYQQQMERAPVQLGPKRRGLSYKLIGCDLLAKNMTERNPADALNKTRALIRHDGDVLAQLLYDLCTVKHIENRRGAKFASCTPQLPIF